ncbi:MAG: HAD domain-containing protein [Pseudomonadota bacterium]
MILFLDFDGVLHPENCIPSDYFVHQNTLAYVLRTFKNLDLVISSTWRAKRNLNNLRALFLPTISQQIVGVTPLYSQLGDSVPETLLGYEREAECVAWLRQNNRLTEQWLALDDRAWNFRPFCKNLFLLDGRVGLNTKKAQDLLFRLGGNA